MSDTSDADISGQVSFFDLFSRAVESRSCFRPARVVRNASSSVGMRDLAGDTRNRCFSHILGVPVVELARSEAPQILEWFAISGDC